MCVEDYRNTGKYTASNAYMVRRQSMLHFPIHRSENKTSINHMASSDLTGMQFKTENRDFLHI